MTNKEDIYALIESYLEGELSSEDRAKFEQDLKTDKELSDAWTLFHELDGILGDKERISVEENIQLTAEAFFERKEEKEKHSQKEAVQKPRLSKKGLLIFTILILGLILAYWAWQSTAHSTISNETLYANYYENYPEAANLRSGENRVLEQLDLGRIAYEEQNYTDSKSILTEVLAESSTNRDQKSIALFYLGLNEMATKDYGVAKLRFQEVISAESMDYRQQSYWYLALIALQEDDRSALRTNLEEVIEISDRGIYTQKAKQLLLELE